MNEHADASHHPDDRGRTRARAFLARNASSPEVASGQTAAELLEAREEAERLAGAGRWAELASVLARLLELELMLGGGEERPDVPGWIPVEELRARVSIATTRERDGSAGAWVVRALAVLVALIVLVGIAVLFL